MACSLARIPYCTAADRSTRAVAVARAGPGPASPVYQAIVFVGVPLTSVVAVPNGTLPTRSGGMAAVTLGPKPRARKAAAFELVAVKLAALSVRSLITPPLTVEGLEVPVIESILLKSACTLSLTLSWLPAAPEATKVISVPLTVMVSPIAKWLVSESVAAAPDSSVAPVIGAGGTALLLTTLPLAIPVVLKKSLPASSADEATSDVLASLPIAVLSAALRLAAVAVEVKPMTKLPAGSGVALEAVSSMDSVVPSGSLNAKLTFSPSLGLAAPRSTEMAAGDPAGPVTVAPVNVDDTALSFSPNGDVATSSATCTDVARGEVMTRRPRPVAPTSACLRSEMTCFNPAWVVFPLRISS